jgi:hypothetical protein
MTRIDPQEEKRRLVEFYRGQMDGELEKVASQAYELTDLAREALKAEIARRGISVQFVESAPVAIKKEPPVMPGDPPPPRPPVEPDPSDGEFELRRLVTIRKFRDLPEALLAKGSVESAGIEAVLTDDNLIRMDWFLSNLIGGIKLHVEPEDEEEANSVLNQPIPEGFTVPGIGQYEQPRCPRCESLDINFRELDQPVAFVSAYFNVPIPLRRRAWRCHSCHAQWEDDDANRDGDESNS